MIVQELLKRGAVVAVGFNVLTPNCPLRRTISRKERPDNKLISLKLHYDGAV